MKTHSPRKGIALALAVVLLVALTVPAIPVASAAPPAGQTDIVELTANYLTDPLGIETDNLRFGWKMESNIIGLSQKSYQIVINEGAPNGATVWNSGTVKSDISVAVPFGGNPAVFKLETRYYWTVTVTDNYGGSYAATAYFETGADWTGVDWITKDGYKGATSNSHIYSTNNMNALMFRNQQPLANFKVTSARLYITGLGNYVSYINGQAVQGEKSTLLSPGWTDYTDYVNYQTYDVTDYITGNDLTLAAIVGSGYYDGRNGGTQAPTFNTAANTTTTLKERCLLAKLVIKYANGTTQKIFTEPGNDWQVNGRTPVLSDGVGRSGEIYDGRIANEFKGWNNVGFDYTDTAVDWSGSVKMLYKGTGSISGKNLIGSDYGVAYEYARLPWVKAYQYKDWTVTGSATAGWTITQPGDIIPGYQWFNGSSSYRTGEIDPSKMVRYNPGDTIVVKDGNTLVVDFGQNASGVPDIVVSGNTPGTILNILNGENVSDGYSTLSGIQTFNYNAEPFPKGAVNYTGGAGNGKRFQYILAGTGEKEYYKADFHFVGYRYLALKPTGGDVTIYGISSVAYSSVRDEVGYIDLPNEYINRFVAASKWSQVSNFVSVPTDCPTREYNGWTGDIQLFAETSFLNYDSAPTIQHFIEIMQKGYAKRGNYNQTMPTTGNGSPSPGWTDAGVVVPWAYYQATGDTSLLELYWTQMCSYTDNRNIQGNYSSTWTSPYGGGTNTGWGDHHAVWSPSGQFTATTYHLYDNYLMAKMAKVLGKEADAAKYSSKFEEIRRYMINRYIAPNGDVLSASAPGEQGMSTTGINLGRVDNAQTALAWMIKLGIYDTEGQKTIMGTNLAKSIANKNGSVYPAMGENVITAGFLGVHVLLPALSKAGLNSSAFDLMRSTEVNSFLYAFAQPDVPSTTVWEEPITWKVEYGYDGGSQNHYAYGASSEWLYEYVLGIGKDEESPSYKHFILQPTLDAKMDYANGSYKSYYGKIESGWEATAGKLTTYSATVPANTTATLYLPVDETKLDGYDQIPGVTYLGLEVHNGEDCAVFDLLSGSYNFKVTANSLVISLAAGYSADSLTNLASIRADQASVAVNNPVSYTVSLENAKGAAVFELSFTFSEDTLDKETITATPLNGFALGIYPELTFQYVGQGIWKGTVKYMYLANNFVNSNSPLDILKISGTAIGTGSATVRLTSIAVQGDNGTGVGTMPSNIRVAVATATIGSKPAVYSKYDLNKDGSIDETDLLYLVYFYQWNDRDAGWDIVDLYSIFAKDCDFQVNGKVDLADMIELTANYGSYDPYA